MHAGVNKRAWLVRWGGEPPKSDMRLLQQRRVTLPSLCVYCYCGGQTLCCCCGVWRPFTQDSAGGPGTCLLLFSSSTLLLSYSSALLGCILPLLYSLLFYSSTLEEARGLLFYSCTFSSSTLLLSYSPTLLLFYSSILLRSILLLLYSSTFYSSATLRVCIFSGGPGRTSMN